MKCISHVKSLMAMSSRIFSEFKACSRMSGCSPIRRSDQRSEDWSSTRGFVRQRWHRDSTTLYPPCPIDLYRDLNGPKEDLVITIGRISPEKRMDAFLEIARKLPNLRFVIIGSVAPDHGPYFQQLQQH